MKTKNKNEYKVVVPEAMVKMLFGMDTENIQKTSLDAEKTNVASMVIGPYAGEKFLLKNVTGWNAQYVCSADVTKGDILLAGEEDLKCVRFEFE